jgi:hypothetical protein
MELFSFREKRAAIHKTTVSKLLKKCRRDSSWFHVVISGGETEKLLGIVACLFRGVYAWNNKNLLRFLQARDPTSRLGRSLI